MYEFVKHIIENIEICRYFDRRGSWAFSQDGIVYQDLTIIKITVHNIYQITVEFTVNVIRDAEYV